MKIKCLFGNALSLLIASLLTASASAHTTQRPDGFLMIDGKPAFPFGFFVDRDADAGRMMTKARAIGQAGFDLIHVAHQPLAYNTAWLDTVQRYGMKVITEGWGETGGANSIVPGFKNHPAILAWNVCDDCDVGGAASPAEVGIRCTFIDSKDPNHPCFGATVGSGASYAATARIVGPELYPVTRQPLRVVYQIAKTAVDAFKPQGHSVISICQTFSWTGGKQRQPTASEVRNMTWQAIAAGSNGVIYYAYNQSTPEQFQEAKSMIPEINTLKPALIDGKRTVLVAQEDFYVVTWEYQDNLYVMCINTSYDDLADVDVWAAYHFVGGFTADASIPIPAKYATATLKSMFAGRPSGLTMQNGKLVGKVAPQDVHIYSLGSGTVPALSPAAISREIRSNAMIPGAKIFSITGRMLGARKSAGVYLSTNGNHTAPVPGLIVR